MTSKSDFSKQEWQLIKDGPDWVFAALAAADGNVAVTLKMKESKVFKSAIKDYRSRSELMAEVLEDSSKVSKDVKSATLSEAEQAIDKISEFLDTKATTAEATEYRRFLLDIAESVAGATGEGILGMGEKFSAKEKQAMSKIKNALKPSPKAAKPAPKKQLKTAPRKTTKPAPRKAKKISVMEGAARRAFKKEGTRPKVIATHVVQGNETWTHLTLKYYGHTTEPYWRYLYEFNKELIGDNYKRFYAGLKIEIPELPDHLKDKD